jgi:hypothetical protein
MPATPFNCDLQHSYPVSFVIPAVDMLAQNRPHRKSPSRHRFGERNAGARSKALLNYSTSKGQIVAYE